MIDPTIATKDGRSFDQFTITPCNIAHGINDKE